MRCSSMTMPGSVATSEPVAITTFFVSSVRLPTITLPAPPSFAAPFTHSTLFFLNRNSTPLTLASTVLSLCAIIAGRSSVTPDTLTPIAARP